MLLNKISPKKRKFIEFLKTINVNNPKPSEIAKDIGISISTYYRWLKDEEFSKIVEQENYDYRFSRLRSQPYRLSNSPSNKRCTHNFNELTNQRFIQLTVSGFRQYFSF